MEGEGLCPVTMTTPANAQNASKTWELSLYELHRTPQVTGIFQPQLTPSHQPSPSLPHYSWPDSVFESPFIFSKH